MRLFACSAGWLDGCLSACVYVCLLCVVCLLVCLFVFVGVLVCVFLFVRVRSDRLCV